MRRDKSSSRITRRLSLTFSNGEVEYNGVTSNISETGLFIRTRKPFPPGTNIIVKIETPDTRDIMMEGVVIWALKTGISDFKDGMGVKLINIPEAYRVLLRKIRGEEI